jgi:4-amino-4-deoxy-L-arabinose transferase-like glycosyltransferase
VRVFAAVALLLVPWLGLSDFHTRGEAREALVAQSMLSSGNWVLPRAYNDALPSKPPLFHWLVASASIPFGEVSEFTSRLPSALAALGALGFFLVMLGKTFSRAGLVLFATILTFSFEWLRAGLSARVDMVHASCLSAGLLSAYFALSDSKMNRWVAATALIALAVLGKGPVAIVIPGIVLTAWICLDSGPKAERLLRAGACLFAALLLSLTWYVSAYVQAPDEFVTKVWYENVSRFNGATEGVPHNHSALFLMGMLFLGTLPWSPLVVGAVITTISRPGFSMRSAWHEAPPLVRFSAVAAITVVLF